MLILSTSSFAKKLTLGCSNLQPLSSRGLENQGFYNQIVKEAGAAVDLDIDIQILPWKRAIALSKRDKLDGISCISYTKARGSWLTYTKTHFFIAERGLFVRKDSQIQSADLTNLKGKTIGVMSGSSAVQFLEKYGKGQMILKEFYNENDALKRLHGKRFDAVFMMKLLGKTRLDDKLPEIAGNIKYLGGLMDNLFYPAIRLTHPRAKEIANKLDVGYQIIKEKGKLEKIMEKLLYYYF